MDAVQMFNADWKTLSAATVVNCPHKTGTAPPDYDASKSGSESGIVWCKIGDICAIYEMLC
jgi:hypothetical protein